MNENIETLFTGTSHIDPDGYNRLWHILERDKPDMILLEVSRMSIILRKTYGRVCRLILDHNIRVLSPGPCSGISNIMSYLDIPREYAAVRDYCSRRGASCRLIDVSIISLARFFHAYKLITKKNISMAAAVHEDSFRQEAVTAGNIFNKNDRLLLNMKLNQFRNDSLALYRERILLCRVKKQVHSNSGRKIMYVGGWEHLMDAPGSGLLYDEFSGPKRRTIAFLDIKE